MSDDENPAVQSDTPPEGQENIEGENKAIESDNPPEYQNQWPTPEPEPAKEPSEEWDKDAT